MARTAFRSDATEARIAARGPVETGGWTAAARARALARLRAEGLPQPRDEYWRFTNPAALNAAEAEPAALLAGDDAPIFADIDRLKLVFVDGVFDASASDEAGLAGVEIERLAVAGSRDIHWARETFGVLEARGQVPVPRPLAALNTAYASDGVLIRVTGRAARPVSIQYLRSGESAEACLHHVVRLEAGAELTLLEDGPAAARLNTVLEVEVGDGARFHHVRAQGRDHQRRAATHVFARLAGEALFKSFTLTVNGALTRNEAIVEMSGDNSVAHVAGAAIGDGNFHHDDTVFVTHDAVNCESRQVFKKVLRNHAVGAFQGKILVRPGAQKTDGYQISQALLLDDGGEFLAKPELEIYADDVACSHGSTSGAIDEDSLFYLRSRGLPEHEAKDLLVLAFLAEAIEEIDDPAIAEDILDRLRAWLLRRRG